MQAVAPLHAWVPSPWDIEQVSTACPMASCPGPRPFPRTSRPPPPARQLDPEPGQEEGVQQGQPGWAGRAGLGAKGAHCHCHPIQQPAKKRKGNPAAAAKVGRGAPGSCSRVGAMGECPTVAGGEDTIKQQRCIGQKKAYFLEFLRDTHSWWEQLCKRHR